MEVHDGLSAAVGEELYLAPGETARARAQCLHYGLFRSEARCELAYAPTAKGDLFRRVHAAQEALGMALEHAAHARDLDSVDSNGVFHAPIVRPPRLVVVSRPKRDLCDRLR